jgi:CheY-like chemotaxis protein
LALLAVRKLLLADDSITIQKIVALTFADAGVEVITVGNGLDAIEALRENAPDVVLADVFMPGKSGYEVCEHVKQTESLKHIPVMLLVGSFEPFDEAEARRVGADDILTKPFQSIRTLMDKVGSLLGRVPADDRGSSSTEEDLSQSMADTIDIPHEEIQLASDESSDQTSKEADTKELPSPEIEPEDPMTAEELEITTADTQPLSPEIKERLEHTQAQSSEAHLMNTTMQPTAPEETTEAFDDSLLDLTEFEPITFSETDDVILDVDFDAPIESCAPPLPRADLRAEMTESSTSAHNYAAPAVADSYHHEVGHGVATVSENEFDEVDAAPEAAAHFVDSDIVAGVAEPEVEPTHLVSPAASVEIPRTEANSPQSSVNLDSLSPEMIDAIARRVVEQMSEKAVQEIAWEVVPQLADLMIKRKLEEQETHSR